MGRDPRAPLVPVVVRPVGATERRNRTTATKTGPLRHIGISSLASAWV